MTIDDTRAALDLLEEIEAQLILVKPDLTVVRRAYRELGELLAD